MHDAIEKLAMCKAAGKCARDHQMTRFVEGKVNQRIAMQKVVAAWLAKKLLGEPDIPEPPLIDGEVVTP